MSNTTGIGARIRVKATVGGSPVWQMRDVSGSDGYCSQSLRQHFGLGDATTVDSLVVSWPSGTEQVFVSVSVDQLLTVVEPSAVGVTEESDALVIVVSEETAGISIVLAGEMLRNLDAPHLRVVLQEILAGERKELPEAADDVKRPLEIAGEPNDRQNRS